MVEMNISYNDQIRYYAQNLWDVIDIQLVSGCWEETILNEANLKMPQVNALINDEIRNAAPESEDQLKIIYTLIALKLLKTIFKEEERQWRLVAKKGINFIKGFGLSLPDNFLDAHPMTQKDVLQIPVWGEAKPVPEPKPEVTEVAEMSDDEEVNFPEGTLEIEVKTLTGKNITLKVTSEETVKILKQRVKKDLKIGVTKQRLIFCGKQMENDEPLSTYEIEEGSTLHLVMRM